MTVGRIDVNALLAESRPLTTRGSQVDTSAPTADPGKTTSISVKEATSSSDRLELSDEAQMILKKKESKLATLFPSPPPSAQPETLGHGEVGKGKGQHGYGPHGQGQVEKGKGQHGQVAGHHHGGHHRPDPPVEKPDPLPPTGQPEPTPPAEQPARSATTTYGTTVEQDTSGETPMLNFTTKTGEKVSLVLDAQKDMQINETSRGLSVLTRGNLTFHQYATPTMENEGVVRIDSNTGNDIFVNFSGNKVNAGAGDDIIISFADNTAIDAGNGNDTLILANKTASGLDVDMGEGSNRILGNELKDSTVVVGSGKNALDVDRITNTSVNIAAPTNSETVEPATQPVMERIPAQMQEKFRLHQQQVPQQAHLEIQLQNRQARGQKQTGQPQEGQERVQAGSQGPPATPPTAPADLSGATMRHGARAYAGHGNQRVPTTQVPGAEGVTSTGGTVEMRGSEQKSEAAQGTATITMGTDPTPLLSMANGPLRLRGDSLTGLGNLLGSIQDGDSATAGKDVSMLRMLSGNTLFSDNGNA